MKKKKKYIKKGGDGAHNIQSVGMPTQYFGGDLPRYFPAGSKELQPGTSAYGDIVASSFALERNYPNPFNPTTTIEYSLGLSGPTKLMIYDVLGRELVKLVDEYRPAGTHKVVWNASSMPSGVYFYRLESSNFVRTQKMILMK